MLLEGIVIGALPVMLVVILLLNNRLSKLETLIQTNEKELDQRLKAHDYAFLSIAESIEMIAKVMATLQSLGGTASSANNKVIKDKIGKIKSATEKFLKIQEITREQFELFGSTQSPSTSALHSKHKNGIAGKLKELEEQKRTVMQSILDDGLDPEILVMDETGEKKSMKMSEAMGLSTVTEKAPVKTDSKSPRRGKLTLVTGDKEDDTDNPGDTTLH